MTKKVPGFSISAAEFSAKSDNLVERRNFSRSSRIQHRYTSLRTLLSTLFSLLSPCFPFLLPLFFFPSSFFSTRVRHIVRTGAKLSVISDGMARLTLPRFYAPSWITRANVHCTCELDVKNWRESGIPRQSVARCEHNKIRKAEGKGDGGMRADLYNEIHNF